MHIRRAAPDRGFGRDNGKLVVAEAPAHVLVSAPTETGKTRGVLAPAAVLWLARRCACRPKTTSCGWYANDVWAQNKSSTYGRTTLRCTRPTPRCARLIRPP